MKKTRMSVVWPRRCFIAGPFSICQTVCYTAGLERVCAVGRVGQWRTQVVRVRGGWSGFTTSHLFWQLKQGGRFKGLSGGASFPRCAIF